MKLNKNALECYFRMTSLKNQQKFGILSCFASQFPKTQTLQIIATTTICSNCLVNVVSHVALYLENFFLNLYTCMYM